MRSSCRRQAAAWQRLCPVGWCHLRPAKCAVRDAGSRCRWCRLFHVRAEHHRCCGQATINRAGLQVRRTYLEDRMRCIGLIGTPSTLAGSVASDAGGERHQDCDPQDREAAPHHHSPLSLHESDVLKGAGSGANSKGRGACASFNEDYGTASRPINP
jgi:hypothetical protein